jgi:formamidopyrimidine-DNA glycosylase
VPVPEAAEVETLRRQLTAQLPLSVAAVTVHHPAVVKSHDPRDLQLLVGQRLVRAERRGKWLSLMTATGPHLGLHLRMSGRLLLSPTPHPHHTHVVFTVTDRSEVCFVDPRRFGEVRVFSGPQPLGARVPDVFAPLAVPDKVRLSRRSVKTVLLDQHALVQGLGNYLADEVCARAGINPTQPFWSLTAPAIARLAALIPATVAEFTDQRGTSLADEGWTDLFGALGTGASRLLVHAREACGVCGAAVTRTKVAARSTYFCPACQR